MKLDFKTDLYEAWVASSGAIEIYSTTKLVDVCATEVEARRIIADLELQK